MVGRAAAEREDGMMLCIGILAIGAGCALTVELIERTVKRLLAKIQKSWLRTVLVVAGGLASFVFVCVQMALSLVLIYLVGAKK